MAEKESEAKFLLINDEDDFREKIKTWLVELTRLQAAEILEAWDGKPALRILKENPQIKDILCDMAMYGMDGLEFAGKIFENGIKDLNAVFWSSNQISSGLLSLYIGKKDLCERKTDNKEQFSAILKKHYPDILKEETI